MTASRETAHRSAISSSGIRPSRRKNRCFFRSGRRRNTHLFSTKDAPRARAPRLRPFACPTRPSSGEPPESLRGGSPRHQRCQASAVRPQLSGTRTLLSVLDTGRHRRLRYRRCGLTFQCCAKTRVPKLQRYLRPVLGAARRDLEASLPPPRFPPPASRQTARMPGRSERSAPAAASSTSGTRTGTIGPDPRARRSTASARRSGSSRRPARRNTARNLLEVSPLPRTPAPGA
jgi:hypothetical protein